MDYIQTVQSAFQDELEKIAISGDFIGKAVASRMGQPGNMLGLPKQVANMANAGNRSRMKQLLGTVNKNFPAPGAPASVKIGSALTEASRDKIAPKNFALSAKQSDTGKPAYPIENKSHASNALARVKQFGNHAEKSEVYKDVAEKYPDLLPEKKKEGGVMDKLRRAGKAVGDHLVKHEDAIEVGGLGVLGIPTADRLQAKLRAGKGASEHDIKKKQFVPGENSHIAAELGGLGTLAAPSLAKLIRGHH